MRTDFRYANMTNVTFKQAGLRKSRFDYARLAFSSFWHANAKGASFHGADLRTADFSRANLKQADFTNTSITDRQLLSALSIRDARLPNGTLARDPNFLKNGCADCNTSVRQNWQIREGNVVATSSGTDPSHCHFAAQASDRETAMLQRINLTAVWDATFWSYTKAVLLARMGNEVSVQIGGISNTGRVIARRTLCKLHC